MTKQLIRLEKQSDRYGDVLDADLEKAYFDAVVLPWAQVADFIPDVGEEQFGCNEREALLVRAALSDLTKSSSATKLVVLAEQKFLTRLVKNGQDIFGVAWDLEDFDPGSYDVPSDARRIGCRTPAPRRVSSQLAQSWLGC